MSSIVDSVVDNVLGKKPGPKSPLLTLIEMACHPQQIEPDLALNLEICDTINTTQKNSPREAAMAIVEYCNSRDLHQQMLALNLLDVCVKNCGYPFHLQIADKDFLNELVKKFPERPSASKTAAQEKILDLIQQWNYGIFEQSKFREDLVHINDMYRLLSHKGYTFPRLKEETTKILKENDGLKTKEELEAEDRKVQSAKLQELLRRGTPADLAAANDLMKVMAGYYHEKQPNYEEKESKEIDKIEEKTNQLIEKLNQLKPGENVADHPEIQSLLASVKTARPKIMKWIEENAGDGDLNKKVDRLLYLNDIMNDVVNRYEMIKGHGVAAANKSQSSPPKAAAPVSKPKQENSLIDFDQNFDPLSQKTEMKKEGPVDLLGELSGLSFNTSSIQPLSTGKGPANSGQIQLDSLLNPTFWSKSPEKTSSIPGPSSMAQLTTSPPPAGIAPFMSSASVQVSSNFVPLSMPQDIPEKLLFEKNGLKISIKVHSRPEGVNCECLFSNSNSFPLSQLVFQLAVPLQLKLTLEPMSGTLLPSKSTNSVMQCFKIENPVKVPIKIRFKVSYMANNIQINEQGEFSNF